MSAGLARSWWAIGLRGIATLLFGIAVLILPSPSIASLVLLFAAYVAADGAFAMLAGWRATSQTERWWTVIVEGATNLAVAATVLVWAALAVVPLISLASGWAIVTGPLAPGLFRRGVGRPRARHRPGAVRGWRSEDDGAVADRLCAGVWRHAPGAHLPPEAAPPEAGGSAHPA